MKNVNINKFFTGLILASLASCGGGGGGGGGAQPTGYGYYNNKSIHEPGCTNGQYASISTSAPRSPRFGGADVVLHDAGIEPWTLMSNINHSMAVLDGVVQSERQLSDTEITNMKDFIARRTLDDISTLKSMLASAHALAWVQCRGSTSIFIEKGMLDLFTTRINNVYKPAIELSVNSVGMVPGRPGIGNMQRDRLKQYNRTTFDALVAKQVNFHRDLLLNGNFY